MATVNPQKKDKDLQAWMQQAQQVIQQVQAAIPQISQSLQTLQQAKEAGMKITPQTTVESAQKYLASISQPKEVTQLEIVTPQDFQKKLASLIRAYEQTLQEKPTITGLTPEEKALYQQATEQLKERYRKALEDLERKAKEEQQRLVARYAAAGFSEPGIIEGPMAGAPGIVTKALQELSEKQARERAQLEQAAAGDILAAQMAEAEAERKAREQAMADWFKEQQRKLEALLKQAGLYEALYETVRPERITIGGRILEKDPISGEWKDVTPAEVLRAIQEEELRKQTETYIDEEGNVWAITPFGMRQLGKVEKGTKKDEKTMNEILSRINQVVDQYKIQPEGFRERLIDLLVKQYGTKYKEFITNAVYTLLPDIKEKQGLYNAKNIPPEVYQDLRSDILAKKRFGGWKFTEEEIFSAYSDVDPTYIKKLIETLRKK